MASRQTIAVLLDAWEPQIRDAFLQAIDGIRSNAEVGRIAEMLERGDVEGALRAVHLDTAAFAALDEAISRAYGAGGAATVSILPTRLPNGNRLVVRFDARNIQAENWLRDHSSKLITNIVEDQRQTIRSVLTVGMEAGNNPRTVALDIIGRVNRATGRREGGIVGLSGPQQRYVDNALGELLSGEEGQLQRYLTRARRDKRFDRSVLKAIRDGKPIERDTISRMVSRYKDGLLQLRGETIGRTEAMSSLHGAQNEAMRQAVSSGAISRQNVRRIWRTAGDNKVRDSHSMANGESVGMDERFSNGLLFPCEPGAPVEEVANCRCTLDVRVDFLANIQ